MIILYKEYNDIINENYNQIALEPNIKVEAKVTNCETKEFKM